MDNVVTAIFEVESEAYQAFFNLRKKPFGEGYVVAEAALVKREGDTFKVADSFDLGVTADDTAAGMMIGSLVGILGGPLGVILGASVGALTGSAYDAVDAIDSASMLEVMSRKLYDNDAAIIALVEEDEPAFDAAFDGFKVTIARHFAVDVYDEVERAREVEAELVNQAKAQLRADLKAERKERKEARKADIAARIAAAKAKHAEDKAALDEAMDIAKAEFVSSTKEMTGEN